MLFNRHPKYYARNLSGVWYQTTDNSNVIAVFSESEFLFGYHPIYDVNTLQAFLTVVVNIASMVVPALNSVILASAISKVCTYYSLLRSVGELVLNSDFNGFVQAIADSVIDENDWEKEFLTPSEYSSKNYTMQWALELMSLSSDLYELADTFNNGPHFYKEVFYKCESDLDYNILIRTSDNKLLSISEINDLIE